jgi:hypothetical protein
MYVCLNVLSVVSTYLCKCGDSCRRCWNWFVCFLVDAGFVLNEFNAYHSEKQIIRTLTDLHNIQVLTADAKLAHCSTYTTAGQTPMKTPTMRWCVLFGPFWGCCWATTKMGWCFPFGPFRGCTGRGGSPLLFAFRKTPRKRKYIG